MGEATHPETEQQNDSVNETVSSINDHQYFDPKLFGIKPIDVILGRGKGSYDWHGNVVYRHLLDKYLPSYSKATKNKDKIQITKMIVTEIKESGGRFLGIGSSSVNGVDDGEELFEISDSAARLKVAQALRHKRGLAEKSCASAGTGKKKRQSLIAIRKMARETDIGKESFCGHTHNDEKNFKDNLGCRSTHIKKTAWQSAEKENPRDILEDDEMLSELAKGVPSDYQLTAMSWSLEAEGEEEFVDVFSRDYHGHDDLSEFFLS